MHLLPPLPPGQPAALLPAYLAAVRHAAGRADPPEPTAHRTPLAALPSAVLRDVGGTYVQQLGTVAVVPLYGFILPRANSYTRYGFATCCDDFARVNELLAADPGVSAVVWDVDSPGGMTAGVPEAADRLMALRGKKPTVAVANSMMASAAYFLGCCAGRVVASPSAMVGSIGVVMVHAEASKLNDRVGVTVSVVRSTPRKMDANADEPLTDAARAELQRIVDGAYTQFVAAVSRGRGVPQRKVRDDFGQGGVMTAAESVAAGLADKVGTLAGVLSALKAGQSADPRMMRAEARIRQSEAFTRGLSS